MTNQARDADLIISRSLPAPPAVVWQGFTSPAALAQWFWQQESFGTIAEADLRVGGQYRIAGPRAGIGVSGRYTVVQPGHRLGFSWQWDGEARESLVSIELEETGAWGLGTDLVLTHQGLADDADRQNHARGWSDCLDRLSAWLGS
jgi:uncharacterized protein YndB with AHSA1/START domain